MYSTATSKKELAFTSGVGLGSRGAAVKRLQEWLNLHSNGIAIDGEFGPATELAMNNFQKAKRISLSSTVTAQTWTALTQPMTNSLASAGGAPAMVSRACLDTANVHLSAHPLEVGGDNRGPWVRLYTGGNEGVEWRWCAGFVSFVMRQACGWAGMATPITGTLSCDTLAAQGQSAQRFIAGRGLSNGAAAVAALGPCAIFLSRRTPGDWTHTGFAFNFNGSTFETIEGNANDEGSSNGYEVCHRIRRLDGDKDFIKLD